MIAKNIPNEESELVLCLSGGGYRAALFHAGALLRLMEADLLADVKTLSSVSGGAILAGILARHWHDITKHADASDRVAAYKRLVIGTVRDMTSQHLDVRVVLSGVLAIGGPARVMASEHARWVGDLRLSALDERINVMFGAASLADGERVVFSSKGVNQLSGTREIIPTPLADAQTPIAIAVAASGAFPPVLGPVRLNTGSGQWASLVDGGTTDNLGLVREALEARRLLVSDASGMLSVNTTPGVALFPNVYLSTQIQRVVGVLTNKAQSLNKQHLFAQFLDRPDSPERKIAFWAMQTSDKGTCSEAVWQKQRLKAHKETAQALSKVNTRLAGMTPRLQEQLINLGYAQCEEKLRCYFDPAIPASTDWPFPKERLDRKPDNVIPRLELIGNMIATISLLWLFVMSFTSNWQLALAGALGTLTALSLVGTVMRRYGIALVLPSWLPFLMVCLMLALKPLLALIPLTAIVLGALFYFCKKQEGVRFTTPKRSTKPKKNHKK